LRILITGGAGFIGAHLARRLLAEDARIDLVDDFSRGQRDPDFAALAGRAWTTCRRTMIWCSTSPLSSEWPT
jgi:UDP-glucose 4-epimerase/UDP-glucuronate decarboxylase